MASILGFIQRNYTVRVSSSQQNERVLTRGLQSYYPPTPPKDSDALRIGILGAADIAPLALINPARSHPGVIVEVCPLASSLWG